MAGHQVNGHRHLAGQLGAHQVFQRRHDSFVGAVDGLRLEHKAHRLLVHEEAGFRIVVAVRQHTAELREAHLPEDIVRLRGRIGHLQGRQQRVDRAGDGVQRITHDPPPFYCRPF